MKALPGDDVTGDGKAVKPDHAGSVRFHREVGTVRFVPSTRVSS